MLHLAGHRAALFRVLEIRKLDSETSCSDRPGRRLVLKNPRFGLFYTPETRGFVVHAGCDLRQDRDTILRRLQLPLEKPRPD